MNLFSLAPQAPFLDALATAWLRRAGGDPMAVARGVILLPTRRAARALADAFLRCSDGRPLLLPRILALGALDEAPLALAGALDLPPAVDPARRLAELSRLILALKGAFGAPKTADRAWMLAGELAALMDDAEQAEIDLARALPGAADAAFAEHWQQTLRFLDIVTRAWPAWLAEQGLMNPAARHVALIEAQALAWEADPPDVPLLAAGMTGAIPVVTRLLGRIARLEHGAVLLPGLDQTMDEAAWDAIEATHPQAGLKRLLDGIGARRGDVLKWPAPACAGPPGRAATLARALLPAASLDQWTAPGKSDIAGLYRLSPADQQEEAAAIALVLREALQTPGNRAALVTPDRDLAGRVAAELARFGIVADDSAGEPLAHTPPAVLLRLAAAALAEKLAPVPLLSLLKHPLAAAGLSPVACREAARALERLCLRGPRPGPNVAGLRLAVGHADEGPARREAEALLTRLEACLEPALRAWASVSTAPATAMAALIEAAEALAATDDLPGPARLWSGEEGEELATLLAGAMESLPVLPDQPPRVIPALLDALLDGAVVRSRRALRGRDGSEHPRIFIWGLLEARLQAVDVVVLGGLTEGIWPPATDPGPWLSRPMRAAIGLPSPEDAVGQAAFDFTATACAATIAVLSAPRRREGAPAVPARWLVRLDAFLAGSGESPLPAHPAVAWARALDMPTGAPKPVAPPQPRPPVALRPRRLPVTAIETWLRDPYAIYARHILRLEKLEELDKSTDAADFGSLVHKAIHRFLHEHGTAWPPGAAEPLRTAMDIELGAAGLRRALTEWWRPRLARIADWIAETERDRRAAHAPAEIKSEISGKWEFLRPGGPFLLTGRADRIERRADGGLVILDYKTGAVPFEKDITAGLAPQLPLEAAMAAEGAFGEQLTGQAAELVYWHLTGGYDRGKQHFVAKSGAPPLAELVATAREKLGELIDLFDDPARPYLSHPHPGRAPRFPDYAQLARVAEWQAAGSGE